jgi:hypothetical protein
VASWMAQVERWPAHMEHPMLKFSYSQSRSLSLFCYVSMGMILKMGHLGTKLNAGHLRIDWRLPRPRWTVVKVEPVWGSIVVLVTAFHGERVQ